MFPSLSAFSANNALHRTSELQETMRTTVRYSARPRALELHATEAFDAPSQRMRKVASHDQFTCRLLPLEAIKNHIEKQFGQQCHAAIDASNVTSSEL